MTALFSNYGDLMPNKYPKKKGWNVPQQIYRVSNWPDYNNYLRNRGNIEFWLCDDAIARWCEPEQINDGTGAPKVFSDFTIIICHEIRMVYRLPLRQTEGFINSLFRMKGLKIRCPDYTTLSKRLKELKIHSPRYLKTDKADASIHAIAIDSTGLKRHGKGEWHQEKHEISSKASWRKLHIAVNEQHYFEGCSLTDRFATDESQVPNLLSQIDDPIDHFTADGAYDKSSVYTGVEVHSQNADVIIPPRTDAVFDENSPTQRKYNLSEIKEHGRMQWQRNQAYGRRNYSELAIQRYKRILGESMHARDLDRQKQEAMIGCGVINKMTSLGMPQSYRIA